MVQPSAVQAGKSGDNVEWQTGAAAVGVTGMGFKAMGIDACLTLAKTVNMASI